jgi:RNA polymerase sigma-70 factor (ECF subfamily)
MEHLAADLYQAMRPSLLGYVYQLLGPCNDAEDLIQMAFLKVFDQLRRNSQIENLRSWLYRVIRNLAIDEIRRKSKLQAVTGVSEFNPDSVAGSLSTEKEIIQRQRIDVSLKILNKRERHCLILRAEGLSYKEISAFIWPAGLKNSRHEMEGIAESTGAVSQHHSVFQPSVCRPGRMWIVWLSSPLCRAFRKQTSQIIHRLRECCTEMESSAIVTFE